MLKNLGHSDRVSEYFVLLGRHMVQRINWRGNSNNRFMFSLKQLILGENHIGWFFPFVQLFSIKIVILLLQCVRHCEGYQDESDMDLAWMGLCCKEVVMTDILYIWMH